MLESRRSVDRFDEFMLLRRKRTLQHKYKGTKVTGYYVTSSHYDVKRTKRVVIASMHTSQYIRTSI